MMWVNDEMGWGWWLLMAVVMVSFWALVFFGITGLFRGSPEALRSAPRPVIEPAEAILLERFARGEMSVQDYHARLEVVASARDEGRVPAP